MIDEIVCDKNYEKIKTENTEIETYPPIEELKYPQEYKYGGIIILNDVNEKKLSDPGIQAMF